VNTGNPQEIGNVARLDWLAGIWDGEGCIALLVFGAGKRASSGNGFRLQMRVTVANSNLGISDRIISILQELGIGHHVQVQMSKTKGRETGRIMKLIHVSTKIHVYNLLKILAPRMADTEKKERARILIEFIEQREAFAQAEGIRATHCYTQADVDLIVEFLRLTRSKQTERLAAILNDCTRETRLTISKKSRARHDTVWPRMRVREDAEMPSRQTALFGQ
jgi:hypothetical protein